MAFFSIFILDSALHIKVFFLLLLAVLCGSTNKKTQKTKNTLYSMVTYKSLTPHLISLPQIRGERFGRSSTTGGEVKEDNFFLPESVVSQHVFPWEITMAFIDQIN